MKAEISKQELLRIVKMASHIADQNSIQPILGCIKAEIREDKNIIAYSTDLETSMISMASCEFVKEPGNFVVDAKSLLEIINALPNDVVELEIQEEHEGILYLRCRNSKYELFLMRNEDFPSIKAPEAEEYVEFSKKDFIRSVNSVAFAASKEQAARNINGIYMESESNILRMVATDTSRLALKELTLEKPIRPMGSLISLKTVKDGLKILDFEKDQKLYFAYEGNFVVFKSGNTILFSRIVDAEFPAYRKVIPETFTTQTRLFTKEFLSAVSRLNIVAQKSDYKLTIIITDNIMSLKTSSPKMGEGEEKVKCHMDGEDVDLDMNGKLVEETLKYIDSEEVEINFTGPASFVVVKPFGKNDYLNILMPLRR
jgi:DNA polymerase-3 subunit beta